MTTVPHPPRTARYGKLILEWAPTYVGGRAVDAQQDKRRLPDRAPGKRIGCLLPHVGISILGCGHDAI
jgi:hypothetical protein